VDPRPALLAEVTRLIGPLVPPALSDSSHVSDIFEAYVFGIVLRAAADLGTDLHYEDVDGNIPAEFVFRSSPGQIYSRERNYCHAVLRFPNQPSLEAHLGVRVLGSSGVLHECDVAVLDRTEAVNCRFNRVEPRQAKVILAVECKFYSTALPLSLARGFVGLATDLPPKRHRILVFNTSSDSGQKYLTAHDYSWEHHVEPGCPIDVQRLRGRFQEVFRNYNAR
jgi:hypothetical protein